jgi:catecholate siderophore receptor
MNRTAVVAMISLCGSSVMGSVLGSEQGELTLPSTDIFAEQSSQPYRSTTAVTATKTDIPLKDVPQTVDVVPAELIKDRNITTLQDALKNVPGVSQDAGDGQRDQFVIRGFSALNDMYLDGMRDDAYYFRDLSNIDRVEVLKGPSSVLYGRGSSGGLINRVTKKPEADPIQQLSIMGSTEGQRRTEMDLGGANENDSIRVRLTGALEDSDGFRDRYFLERQALAPSIQFNIDSDTTLTLQADYLHDKRLADTGLPAYGDHPVDADIDTYYGSRDAKDQNYVETTVKGSTITLDRTLSDSLSLHSALRAYDSDVTRKYVTFGTVNTTTNKVSINRAARYKEESGVFWQNEFKHVFETGPFSHEALYGIEVGYQDRKDKGLTLRNVATYDLFNPQLIDFPEIPGNTAANPDADTHISIAGLYLQDLITLTPEWKLMIGGRFDRLATKRSDDGTADMDLERTDNTFSPRIGLVYEPVDWVSLYATYSRSFQPMADNGELRRNSDELDPEETVNKEVGAKFDINDKLSATVSVFDMTRTGILMDDPTDTRFSLDAGEQRTRGVEVSVNGDLGNGWSTYAGYAWLKGEMIDSPVESIVGNTSPLTPKSSASVWLKKELGGGFYVAGGGRYEGERFTSPNNKVSLGSYTTAELAGGYRSEHYDVTLNVDNLFNREYFVSAKAGSDNSNYPGAPRNANLRVDYRF